jgi:hypothetical protein
MWSPGNGDWRNESLFAAARIGQPNLPNQLPGVSVLNGQLMVTCEDNTGQAWYFVVPPGGTWGVAALP